MALLPRAARERFPGIERSRYLRLVMFGVIGAALALPTLALAQSGDEAASTARAVGEVVITEGGFEPAEITVATGESVHWTNRSESEETVTSDITGAFSARLRPGAGYTMTLARPGTFTYHSETAPNVKGTLRVVMRELDGEPSATALDHLPDFDAPPQDPDDLGFHPTFTVSASRTRILLGFTPEATVADANAALSGADVEILGGHPSFGLLAVAAPDTPDFSGLTAALDSLRAHPGVAFAAMALAQSVDSLPRASSDEFQNLARWQWRLEEDGSVPAGLGNWWLLHARVPQAWSLLETVRRRDGWIDTAVLDGGFDQPHGDLSALTRQTLCESGLINWCTSGSGESDLDSAHGNAAAGVVGADYDNADKKHGGRAWAMAGMNPVAKMHGVALSRSRLQGPEGNTPFPGYRTKVATLVDTAAVYELMLDEKRPDGKMPNLRVINYSVGSSFERRSETDRTYTWPDRFPDPVCGPGPDDDNGVGANQWCTPATHDGWLREFADIGKAARAIAERAAEEDVLIAQSAGNDGGKFVFCGSSAVCEKPSIPARVVAPFGWASTNWTRAGQPPILVVESLGETGQRSGFSNHGGDIAAPGEDMVAPQLSHGFDFVSGTSFSAPMVSGAAGYLLAYRPELTTTELRAALIEGANATGRVNGTPPALDVFASLLSLPGAGAALVDVNDYSQEGNRRMVLGPGGTPDAPDIWLPSSPYVTAPDATIDMRDFRRFRDAWLQTCISAAAEGSTTQDCPAPADIRLNGTDGHPKKDLNFDRCVFHGTDPAGCSTSERFFSRFDFNGDGMLRRSALAPVPLASDGSPAPTRPHPQLTDLQVFQTQWPPGPVAGPEGWSATDLDALMTSGDVEIHAQDFFDAGATDVQLRLRRMDTGTELERADTTLTAADQFVVASVPSSGVEVSATATVNGEQLEAPPQELKPLPGEDLRVDLCAMRLELTAAPTSLRADGESTARIAAAVRACGDTTSLEGREVTFAITPQGPGHATLDAHSATTDAAGDAAVTLTAGTVGADYDIHATVELADGQTVEATLTVPVRPKLTVTYMWRQTTDEWSQQGSTVWPGATPDMPDCRNAGVEYCIEQFTIGPDRAAADAGLAREGTLTATEPSTVLTERVTASVNASHSTWTLTDPDGSNPRDAESHAMWGVAAGEETRYTDHPMPGVVIDDQPDGVSVAGLREVGELGYPHTLTATRSGDAIKPIETHSVISSLLLVPRGDGSALQYATTADQPVVFPRQPDGSLEPYRYCATVPSDLTTVPGYRMAAPSPWITGAETLERDPVFDPGDRPMPVGPGSVTVTYAFAAVAHYGDEPVDVSLPDCATPSPPEAEFDWEPVQPGEGRSVIFTDRSTDPDNDIASWEWVLPNGETKTTRNPQVFFSDDGTFTVELTVTDTGGRSATVRKTIVVDNLPPEAEVKGDTTQQQRAPDGTLSSRSTIAYRLADPGSEDKKALDWSITSSEPGFPAGVGGTAAANAYSLVIEDLAPGTYPITLTVTDKDGASASATDTVVVVPPDAPPPQPPPPLEEESSCDTDVTLDGEEAEFWRAVNEYRAENGLEPVGISPTLTKAAERHVADMASGDFLDHTGSDGSSPLGRARDAGFTGRSVGENIASGYDTGRDVLFAWRGSQTGHNENMLADPWRAVGIARQQGPSGMYWATTYGDVLDCDAPSAGPSQQTAASADDEQTTADPAEAEATDQTALARAAAQPVLARYATSDGVMHTAASDTSVTAVPDVQQSPADGPPESDEQAAAAAGPDATVVGFVVSRTIPETGATVVFTNAARDRDGLPLAGIFDFGDGSPPVAVEPGASVEHQFTEAATVEVALAVGRRQATRTLTVGGVQPTTLSLRSTPAGVAGGSANVVVRLRTDSGPLTGAGLTFDLAGQQANATTDAEGIATATLDLPEQSGTYQLAVEFAGSDNHAPAALITDFTVSSNLAPAADAGGPYQLTTGSDLALDGTKSGDPDPGDHLTAYDWDLNGDGAFGDVTGALPAPLPWAEVEELVCAGTCVSGERYPIALRVTDSVGATGTTGTRLLLVDDFTILLDPSRQVLNPGGSAVFTVSVVGSEGFTSPVTLSVEELPAGVTAQFNPVTVTPSATSQLTVTAAQDAEAFETPLVVVGEGGGIRRETTGEVEVAFGLVPRCYGTFIGVVTDTETGDRLAGVKVFGVLTDAAGRYRREQVGLGQDNAPAQYQLSATMTGYWSQHKYATAYCDTETVTNFALLRERTGKVSGTVARGVVEPGTTTVTRTGTMLSGVTVREHSSGHQVTTDGQGRYITGPLRLQPGNLPRRSTLRAQLPGYWWQDKPVDVTADTTQSLGFELVEQCHATITGGVVTNRDSGEPLQGATVRLSIGWATYQSVSDAEGRWQLDHTVLLGYNNSATSYYVSVSPPANSPPGSVGESKWLAVDDCGEEVGADLTVFVAPPRVERRGTLEGVVTDAETGAPIAGARVYIPYQATGPLTDDNGAYRWEDIHIGYDDTTSRTIYPSIAGSSTHWEASPIAVTLRDGEVTKQDFTVLRKRYGTVEGTVLDAATKAPLENVLVFYDSLGPVRTDAQGQYRSDRVQLTAGNKPRTFSLQPSPDGYWWQSKSVTVTADATSTVDFELTRRCETSRVVGVVVDATTQEPIEGATVSGMGRSVRTNAAGRFEIADIAPSYNNEPYRTAITASATGYYAQTKYVTLFCGAVITLDFGKPQTVLGTIIGTVTDASGAAMPDVFIGSEFGGSATTDASGDYRLTDVPLGDNNAERTWTVTAIPSGRPAQQKSVTAKAGEDVRLDFVFGALGRPVAEDLAFTSEDGADVPITLRATDPDGDDVAYRITADPAHGALSGTPPAVTYAPDPEFAGQDTFTYVASDGQGDSNPATVTITVTRGAQGNRPPQATDLSVRTTQDTPVAVRLLGADPDGDALQFRVVDEPSSGTLSGTPPELTYTPATGFADVDRFTYVASDGQLESDAATVTITVTKTTDPGDGGSDPGDGGSDPGGGGGAPGGGGGGEVPAEPPIRPAEPEPGRTTRVAGATGVETAVAISRAGYPDQAPAVVLARADIFADSLAGTPFAARLDAPILLTRPQRLEPSAEAELRRVLPTGRTVFLLGGDAALSPDVERHVRALGYETVRVAGRDRFATSVAIADRLGAPSTVLLANGRDFADALSAGPAAAAEGAAVLLTSGDEMAVETADYLVNRDPAAVYAIGGSASRAAPGATPLVGADRFGTAVLVAERFFAHPPAIGVATARGFADALTGGAHIAGLGGPMLLAGEDMPDLVLDYVTSHASTIDRAYVYGGEAALSAEVMERIDAALARG